ncbi:hypothetical protein BDB00DRAFT_806288 [Zychaea mexicana]|uniref:uncharacterized protein n=1 Tax=Zychaea mexicana TaxID=64656 RepID=UPI0022FE769B|nr:uncharacterized protein BDB00DRAFT_806288 [Zychaea mexicana]KAI9496982.1 hypothetical protein BDB00DRAFT_806288 [Zychaea mexicana]
MESTTVISTPAATSPGAPTTTESQEPTQQHDVITEEYDASQRQVNDLIASLRMDLLSSRSEVASLKGKVNSLTVQNLDLTIKYHADDSKDAANKLQVQLLEQRLDELKKNEFEHHQRILDMEQTQSILKDEKQKQYHEHLAEKAALQKERDNLTKKYNDLQLELTNCHAEASSTKIEKKTLQQRLDELELNRMGDAKAHEDMIAIFEKQQKESEAQLQNAIAAEARARQDAKSIQERFQKENDQLQQQLVECQDRLSIIRSRSDGSSPSDTALGTTTLPDGKHGNLIQLMRRYEEGGKSWECIYEDYFELKDAHSKAVAQCETMRVANEQLMREQRDKEQRYQRMEVEYRRLHSETEAVRDRARRSETAQNENEQVVNSLHAKIGELQRKNNDLQTSLGEVAYQLRQVICDVESRNEMLPPGVKSSSDLLQYASQSPEFSHEDLTFNNVAQLQEQNQKLLERIRKLDEDVKEKTRAAEQLRQEGLDAEEKYTLSLNQAQETIKDLNYSVISLERRLQATIKQRDMYKLGVSEDDATSEQAHGDNIPNNTTTQPQQQEEDEEDEAYRYAMQQNMKQLQTELQEAQTAASASNSRLKITEAEIIKLRKECQDLLQTQASRSAELKDLRTRNAELQCRLSENEKHLANYHNELLSYRSQQEMLRVQNTSLRSELDFSHQMHKKLAEHHATLSSRCAHLTSLLHSVTTKNKDSTSAQTEGISLLKKQIEAQDKELENLRVKLESAQQGLADGDLREQDHWKNKYNEVHRELQRLNVSQLELQKELAAAKEQRIALETKLSLLIKQDGGSAEQQEVAAGEQEHQQQQAEGQEDGTFEARYTELAAANMELDKLRLQIADYEEQLEKQRQETEKMAKDHDEFTTDMQSKLVKLHQDLSDRDGMIKAAQTATEDIQRLKLERVEAEQQWSAAREALNGEKEALQQRVQEYEEEAARLRQQIETQTELINEGKEKLELEVSTHVDDNETIKSLREESSRLTEEISTAKNELTTLQSRLQISEESYSKQKEQWEVTESRLKTELENSSKRFDELLQSLAAEQQGATAAEDQSADSNMPIPMDVSNKSKEQLELLVVSVRQKNEILQRQYKAAISKTDQLRSDLQFTQKQVAAFKAQVEAVRAQNVEIESKCQEATRKAQDEAVVYKENNTQLRTTIADLRSQVCTLEKQATESKAAVQPLTDKVATLEAQIKAHTETIETLEKSKQEWDTRTAQIMSKYNKLDPAEVEAAKQERDAMKAQIEPLEKAKTEAEAKLKTLEEQKTALEKELEETKTKVTRFQNAALNFKKRMEQAQEQLKNTAASPAPASAPASPAPAGSGNAADDEEKKALEEKLQKAISEKEQAETNLAQRVNLHTELQGKHKGLLERTRAILAEKNTLAQAHKDCEENISKLREELKKSTEDLNKSTEELNQQKDETKKAKEEAAKLTSELEAVNKAKMEAEMEAQRGKVKQSFDQSKITRLTKELEEFKKRAREEDDDKQAEEAPAAKMQKQENNAAE